MAEFVPCVVETRTSQVDVPVPVQIFHNDTTLWVTDVGRNWQDEDGLHILVRIRDGRTLELCKHDEQWMFKVISQSPNFFV
jgi:hypothetical protein